MKTSETTAALFEALTKAAPLLQNAIKSERANAGKFSYTYADFADIANEVRSVLGGHDLAALQEETTDSGLVGVTTILIHSSGEWIALGPLHLPAGEGPQDYGSALTYARRYSLTAALLIAAEEDDDGAKAQANKTSGGGSKRPKSLAQGEGASDSAGSPSDANVEGAGTGVELTAQAAHTAGTENPALFAPTCPKCSGPMLSGEMHHDNGPSNRWICADPKCSKAIPKETANA